MRVRSLILVLGAIGLVACGDSGNGGQDPGDQVPEGDVQVRNNLFDPSQLEADSGATVVWAWNSRGTAHNVTFDDGPTSGDRGSGTYERTFTVLGGYPYHCTIHGAAMSGVVNVVAVPAPGDGGGGGDGGGYPDGNPGGY